MGLGKLKFDKIMLMLQKKLVHDERASVKLRIHVRSC